MKLTSIALLILGYGTLIFGEVIQNGDGNSHGEPHQKDIVTNKVHIDYNNQKNDFLLDYFTNKKVSCGKRFFDQRFGNRDSRSRIIGGVTAVKGAYPWQVNLHHNQWEAQTCGGTIIDDHHVLTAAHCLVKTDGQFFEINPFTIIVGDHDLSKREKSEQHLHIADIVIHAQYDAWTGNNDIAIIKTKEQIRFGEYVQPACIATRNTWRLYKPGTKVLVSGWGLWKGLRHNGTYPDKLKAAQMVVYDFKKCKKNYREGGGYPPLTWNMFCANNEEGYGQVQAACFGDSGGPVVVERKGKFFLTGIVSWGSYRCATRGLPGVHTRVDRYTKWIENAKKRMK